MEFLITAIILIVVAAFGLAINKYAPPQLRTTLYSILGGLATKALGSLSAPITAKQVVIPQLKAPKYEGTISGAEVRKLLEPYGITMYQTVDRAYILTTLAECERFLKHFKTEEPYTADDFDCDDYAWLMRAEAMRWSKGKLPWGYIEARSLLNSIISFGPHAFNIIVTNHLDVYFVDELKTATEDKLIAPAFKIDCRVARI